ncbi:6-phosphogluconolactonase [Maritalea mediterranea]|uniref:6-phosphogluconolactonase n=1 Tax=Maritalea mediterranea TaxID=2909667 RepID=A0ABS9E7N7_9HYPH|nr:6-phosphogluconolactonase [Maritalea mediterranea]MCF4097443.1 6-phosphogluconolactonase [Maritalea mediterranea]
MADVIDQKFNGKDQLARALAYRVATELKRDIEAAGKASMLVSGGSTPKAFFEALSEEELDWTRVTISLVDERWVPPSSDRSNAKLVGEHLLQNKANGAAFMPLYIDGVSAQEGAKALGEQFAGVHKPFTVVILGMGTDGHTASFFPEGDQLAEAIDMKNPNTFAAIEAPGAGEPRITFTLPQLLQSSFLALHIEGDEKRDVLKKALGEGETEEMPIRAVLRQTMKEVNIFWCP